MIGACSIPTGHASTQALHWVQDQTASARTPSSRTTGRAKPPSSGCVAPTSMPRTPPTPTSRIAAFDCSRSSSTTSRGDSGRPVARAGHASWHFPHFVQASRLSMWTPLKSASAPYPAGSEASSGGIAFSRLPACGSRTTREPKLASMCDALV